MLNKKHKVCKEKSLTLGSLFAGIGGFELAATWAGIQPVWSNEIDSFCCKVLRKNFDHEIIEKDIKEIRFRNLPKVDVLTAGVPCQPASIAGKRKGTKDDRWLWDETIRIVRELKPSYVICENPPGILNLENGKPFEQILYALENEGYTIELFNIPACSVGAEHKRYRLFIIAYNNKGRDKHNTREVQRTTKAIKRKTWKQNGKRLRGKPDTALQEQITPYPNSKRMEGSAKEQVLQKQNLQSRQIKQSFQEANRRFNTFESRLCRTLHGIPFGVDRIRSLGNSIVPQVAFELFKAILQIDNGHIN